MIIGSKGTLPAIALAAGIASAQATHAETRLADGPLDLRQLRNPVWTSVDNLRDPSVLKVPDGYRVYY